LALHIYCRKKNLVGSIIWYLFGLCVWLGVYFFSLFPILSNRHPNVGEATHYFLFALLTFIFAAWAVKMVKVLIHCLSEYQGAPSIAYTLTEDGITGRKKKWSLLWEGIYDVRSIVKTEGCYFRNNKKVGFAMESWGIEPEEMKKAKGYISKNLPDDKTKGLR